MIPEETGAVRHRGNLVQISEFFGRVIAAASCPDFPFAPAQPTFALEAKERGLATAATPPEQRCAWGVSWPVLGDPAKSRLLVEPAGHPVGSGGSEVGSAVGTARSGRGCSARAGLTGVEWSRLRAELHRYPVY